MFESAKWITAGDRLGTVSPEFRKSKTIIKRVRKATAHITAMGVYELRINGTRVGDALMTPGWTSYFHRVQYQTYDITELVTEHLEIGIRCGNGWAVGYIGGHDLKNVFASEISTIGQIDLSYEDGTTESIGTDQTWEVFSTPILESEIYHGETVDLTAPIKSYGYATETVVDTTPVEHVGEFVREQERICAKELIVTPKGERVIDFGQNLVGYVEIRISGKRGSRIVLSHAEVLDRDGNFYTGNYRTARNLNTYVLSGGEDVFKPSFSFQGYRYIRLDEYPFDEVDLSAFTSVAAYSDMKRIGHFHCGNEKVNQLYSNILWGQRSNFFDLPTDCPQRDERLGWLGDAQVFCRTASINYHTKKFFTKWLGDVMLEQHEDGGLSGIVPMTVDFRRKSIRTKVSAAWGDAATICPWELYKAYGDLELLRSHYDMMKKWVEYMHGAGDEEFLWIGGEHYGDWLAMDSVGENRYGGTQTDLIASAFFAYSTELVIKAGRILGEDVSYFEELYGKVRAAFRKAFMKDGLPVLYPKADGLSTDRPVKGLTQCSLVLILHFRLYEKSERQGLVDKLVSMIRENGTRMTTGFVGTPYILHVLSENGYADVAYDLLLQEKNPSWLFSVLRGATTMWEHWDSIKEDGTFWSTTMNSFNHYAYGAVCDWLFGGAAGIRVLDDGAAYRHIQIKPHTDPRLGFVDYSIETDRGILSSSWRYIGSEVRYEITVPSDTVAELQLPNGKTATLTKGTYLFVEAV